MGIQRKVSSCKESEMEVFLRTEERIILFMLMDSALKYFI